MAYLKIVVTFQMLVIPKFDTCFATKLQTYR